jgi:non-ribosomal peptide synthetase component E (peptide arylation enzyme)
MWPDRYAVVDALPLLANGKIDRLAVKALMGSGDDDE